MSNPPKSKGTGGEREVVNMFAAGGIVARRTAPGLNYDLYVSGARLDEPFEVLATRPDRGEWLATIRLADLVELLRVYNGLDDDTYPVKVEVKRYARFSLHTIFTKKFGRKRGTS